MLEKIEYNDTQIYVVFNTKFNKMEEDKNLEQNLDKSNEKLHISGVIKSLPTQDELWLMSGQYSTECGLQNFFDEDEIIIIRNHWCNGFTKGIKNFVNSEYRGLD
jgi:stalled ribosome rescue protein Dom34